MNRKINRIGTAALALTLSLGVAACSEEQPEAVDTTVETTTDDMNEDMTSEEPTEDETMGESDIASQVFGPGCSALPTSGAGSLDGMVSAPVANAASANPLLETLVTAVNQAGLVDTLNNAENITVFAPTNEAFAAIPEKDLQAVLNDKEMLTNILTHHVIGQQLSPDELAGTYETLAGTELTVEGEGEEFNVGDENAQILCGNIPTANATVYVVDTVLMPEMN